MNQRKKFISFGVRAVALCALLGLLAGGCTRARIPITGIEVPMIDIPLPAVLRAERDLRGRSWSKAFGILHERMVREYAYTGHKRLDWDALYEQTAAKVIAAEKTRDNEAWYRSLRTYLHAIPDGNVSIDLNDAIRDRQVGASAGLALAELADGSVIVSGLVEGGPAEAAGIAWGATILAWDGVPMAEALEEADILWAESPAATSSVRRRQQLDWLPRGPAESAHTISYMNPGSGAQAEALVTLAPDNYATLPMNRPLWSPVELFSSPISTRLEEGGYRYIRVAAIAPTFSTPFPVRDFKAAVRLAAREVAPGVILDLRGTQGGDASLVPRFLECLVTEQTFFEVPGVWDLESEAYLAETEKTVYVNPEEPTFTGPVVVLVDSYTMGPPESLAGFLQRRENVRIFGDGATHGSSGVPSVELILPGNYNVVYPDRRALNEAGQVQGVADATGAGAVEPDPVFALDRINAAAIYQDGKDAVLAKALELLDSATWRFP